MRGRLGTAVSSSFVLIALVLVAAPPASSGGATLDFQREHYVAGDEVYGRTAVWLGASAGDLKDAPFFAYLLPQGRSIRPPQIPPSAIPVGPLRVRRIQHPTGRSTAIAGVRFTLPDVPPGMYIVEFCNEPCTSMVFGDLTFGRIEVVSSLDQIRIYQLGERLDALRATLKRAERERIRQYHRATRDLDSLEQIIMMVASQLGVGRAGGTLVGRLPMGRIGLHCSRSWAPWAVPGKASSEGRGARPPGSEAGTAGGTARQSRAGEGTGACRQVARPSGRFAGVVPGELGDQHRQDNHPDDDSHTAGHH
jgi:hypothetical protein